jgi:hypothetical protein
MTKRPKTGSFSEYKVKLSKNREESLEKKEKQENVDVK